MAYVEQSRDVERLVIGRSGGRPVGLFNQLPIRSAVRCVILAGLAYTSDYVRTTIIGALRQMRIRSINHRI